MVKRALLTLCCVVWVGLTSQSCGESGNNRSGSDSPVSTEVGSGSSAGPLSVLDAVDQFLPSGGKPGLAEAWKGDLDGMVERRHIRVLVTPNRSSYFFDGVEQRGTAFELLRMLEEQINKDLGRRSLKVHIVILPTSRDNLIPGLVDGHADLVASNLTITDLRQQQVDFSNPLAKEIREIVVTGPGAPELSTIEDLSGQEVFVRRSSSYWESLTVLNESLEDSGKEPVKLEAVSELLETEDILEMVNAGVVPITIADEYIADFWAGILDNIEPRHDLALRSDGQLAWAYRKDSPQLAAVIDKFVKTHKQGTLLGNTLIKRYWLNHKYVDNPMDEEGRQKLEAMGALFEKYADQYDFDYLLLIAQGYQESHLVQNTRSRSGAIGVMQLLKSTASDPNVGIPNIEELEPNIHAGVRYLRFLADRYFADEEISPLDRTLLSFAAYNVGPARVTKLRNQAAAAGLDPNVWFDNVETVAARQVGREPVQYVSNIFKYYTAYSLALEQARRKQSVKG